VSFDIYTCLPDVRHLDYGKANVFADGVEFISMRASKVGRGDDASSKYIKVKWGEQRHLIAEHHVSNFAIMLPVAAHTISRKALLMMNSFRISMVRANLLPSCPPCRPHTANMCVNP
jgi:hypothetical protein